MVVDDESDLQEYYGLVVDASNGPKEALSSFKPNFYNLVTLDFKIPGMDGFELCREIKEIDLKSFFPTASELYHEEH